MVIAAQIHRLALTCGQFGQDLGFIVRQRLGDGGKMRGQFGAFGLRGQSLRPIERKVEMAVAVVGLAHAAFWRFVMIQDTLGRSIHGFAQDAGLFVAFDIGQEFQAFAERAEFAQGIPAQVVFFDQLLHVLGG